MQRVTVIRTTAMLWLVGILASSTAHAAVPTWSDVAYGGNWRQRLDIYLPNNGAAVHPLVIFIHGGGWLDGDKSSVASHVDGLLARGLAVASINYRLTYQTSFPAQIHDCKGAVRFLRANAAQFGLDPSRFGVFGESAGGHLASLLANSAGVPALEGNVGGNGAFSSSVQAVVHVYGPTDLFALAQFSPQRAAEVTALIGHDILDIIENANDPAYASLVQLVHSANPAMHASIDAPATYIVHGEEDDVVPITQSEVLDQALKGVGAFSVFRSMAGVGHSIPEWELPAVYDFFLEHLDAQQFQWELSGLEQDERFGWQVASIGDVDGDGVSDLAIGAPYNDDRGKDAGRVEIVCGETGSRIRTLRGRRTGERFGFSVAGCGDIDGDGVDDVVIGAPRAIIAGQRRGRVDVFSGATWQRLYSFDGLENGDQFGYAVAATDLDGDGKRDFIIAAPYADQPASNAGSVTVYSGNDGSALRLLRGKHKNDRFGWSVADAGDANGDGRHDVVIGAPFSDQQGSNSGSVFVIGKTGATWKTLLVRHGSAGDTLGWVVAGVEDVDGDGLADVAVGVPRREALAGVRSGAVRVYSPSSRTLIAEVVPDDPQHGERFGSAICVSDDANGDGTHDMVIGSPQHSSHAQLTGRVGVYALDGTMLRQFFGLIPDAQLGTSVTRSLLPSPWFYVGAPLQRFDSLDCGAVLRFEIDPEP